MNGITEEHCTERISMRVSRDDKLKLEKMSKKNNQSYSDTVRNLINGAYHRFKLEKQDDNREVDYSVEGHGARVNHAIEVLADSINDDVYHELAHQLSGTKAEFSDDDGEAHVLGDRKYFTVKASLYRGIFWKTLERLDNLDEKD